MTDLYVRSSEEVRDRDDGERLVCHIFKPDRAGERWTAYHAGKRFEEATRGRLLSQIERYMVHAYFLCQFSHVRF